MQKKTIPDWDTYFLEIAKAVSNRSSCLKANVGAVIVGNDFKIKSTGYNSPPHGVEDSTSKGFCNKERLGFKSGEGYEVCRSIHAEQNAIIQAGSSVCAEATIYIWGHDFICNLCTKFIVQAGIIRSVLKKDEISLVVVKTKQELIKSLEELG